MKEHTENLLEMNIFYNIKCKVYPHAKLNTSEGVIRSREIETVLKKKSRV